MSEFPPTSKDVRQVIEDAEFRCYMFGVEFGYKMAESGENIEATKDAAKKAWSQRGP